MMTESPVMMMSGGERGNSRALGESLRSGNGSGYGSSQDLDGITELGRLLKGRTKFDNILNSGHVPQRSGSAPPSVEGSLAAMGGMFDLPTSPKGGRSPNLQPGEEDVLNAEDAQRADPRYLVYYYSNINLNPRLPPPLISWNNYRLAQRLQSGMGSGGFGDKKKLRSMDDSSSRSLFSTQPVLPTHREEPEVQEEEISPMGGLARTVSSDWAERDRGDGFMGLSSEFHPRNKSLVDMIQEDFPRTPSPVFHLSRSSSRAANDENEATNAVLDLQLAHLRESASGEANAVANGMGSRSTTPIPGVSNLHQASGPAAPVPRIPTPEISLSNNVRSASPSLARMGSVPGLSGGNLSFSGSDARSVGLGRASSASAADFAQFAMQLNRSASASTADFEAAFKGLSMSDMEEAIAAREGKEMKQKQQQQLQQQQEQQQHRQRAQIAAQVQAQAQVAQSAQTLAYSQALQQQHLYPGVDPAYRGQPKFAVGNMASQQAGAAGLQPNLGANTNPANMYAAAAAAMYMAQQNLYYPNMNPAAVYGPQYGLGGYPVNPAMLAPMMAGYPLPMFDPATAAALASMGVRAGVPGSSAHSAVDIQNLYKYAGRALPQIHDPMYLQYIRMAESTAAALDPSLLRNYMGGDPLDTVNLQKKQLSSMLGVYGAEQKSEFGRTGTMGVPITSQKSGSVSPGYYGSPPGVPYNNSPLTSPVLPGSPVGLGSYPIRRDDRNLRSSSTSRTSGGYMGAASGTTYGGWQGQKTSETPDETRGSTLLEEFKNSKTRRFDLLDITEHVVEFSVDQHGSRFIQQKLETATPEDKNMVFQEVLPRALTLMTDVFGNYVIQKFFEHGTQQQRRELANQLVGHVLVLSLQMYGCRVIQKALEVVDVDQQTVLVSELDGHVMRCVRDQNGNHVIQKCIECVPPAKINFIISAFYNQVVTLSTHPYGCRVIQRVLEHCTDEQKQKGIMEEILRSTCTLAQDQYGNYVVQHVLEHGRDYERTEIITKLAGQIVQMSQHKFASNVVEKCLEYGGPVERQILIDEMLGHTDENEPLQAMMKDQFANYVVQKVLETCDESQRELLLGRIRVHLHALKKYTYGKHIVARVEKLVAAGERRSAAYMAHNMSN
uniref:PUF-domain RNA-binding protein n=1 Tax=Physcomitrium patens TaxID=3218 RepID=Q4KSL4_PHYPA|nr:PUF-domain RNA-binding protein [Physcomitrium patens]